MKHTPHITETETVCQKGARGMANTKEQIQEQSVAFRGKGADNEYRVLLGEQEIGRVKRVLKGDDQGKWFAVGTDGKRLKGDPTSRSKAGQTLIKS
jgi:hypothetical protein